ncbi:hypothetical protein K438DRAFT_1761944 [Mycena galopus ATCC 62051]|nr:hypothetical protein K438DRAFT_1761944 [Mycena galopus ATCC 62051]
MSFDDSYGELANHLILLAKRSLDLQKLLPYDGPLVRLVIQEQHELSRKIGAMEAGGITMHHVRWPALVIFAAVIHRNKRCLLAYHSQRLDTIRTAYWAAGGALAHVIEKLREEMSQDEITYLRSHHESVVEYRQQVSASDGFGLAMGIEDPPTDSMLVTVEMVVSPGGPIYTESGLIDFRFGSGTYYRSKI